VSDFLTEKVFGEKGLSKVWMFKPPQFPGMEAIHFASFFQPGRRYLLEFKLCSNLIFVRISAKQETVA
jgi:hypothetical protein